jgi:hypothetical protein
MNLPFGRKLLRTIFVLKFWTEFRPNFPNTADNNLRFGVILTYKWSCFALFTRKLRPKLIHKIGPRRLRTETATTSWRWTSATTTRSARSRASRRATNGEHDILLLIRVATCLEHKSCMDQYHWSSEDVFARVPWPVWPDWATIALGIFAKITEIAPSIGLLYSKVKVVYSFSQKNGLGYM